MKAYTCAPASDQEVELDVFCSKVEDAYRVYVRPLWMPDHLLECFDDSGEAFPVYLDFDDLDYHMKRSGVEYTKRPSKLGSIQLYARGGAATVMTNWLVNACSSDTRSL
jgi:hypothetical protein